MRSAFIVLTRTHFIDHVSNEDLCLLMDSLPTCYRRYLWQVFVSP